MMKQVTALHVSMALFISMMSVITAGRASDAVLEGLEDFEWKNRVLLVYASKSSSSAALANLKELAPGIEERDIAWFLFADNGLQSNIPGTVNERFRTQVLETYFAPRPEQNRVILIGKDGGVKSEGDDLDLLETFELIDQMPMRKAEIRP